MQTESMKTLARLRRAIRSRWRWLAAAVCGPHRLRPLAAARTDRPGAPRPRRHDVDGRCRPSRCAALRVAVGRRHAQRAPRREEPAAGTGRGDDCRRRSPLLVASRRRPGRNREGAAAERLRRSHRRGRIDNHAAGGEAPAEPAVAEARAGRPREDPRSGARAAARASVRQARDSWPVPQSRRLRQSGRGCRKSRPTSISGPSRRCSPRRRRRFWPAFRNGRRATTRSAAAIRRSPGNARSFAAWRQPAPCRAITHARHGTNDCASRATRRRFSLRTSSKWLSPPPAATCRRGSRQRSTPGCRAMSSASSEVIARRSSGTAPPTSRLSFSTTRAGSGWRGKDRATTRMPSTVGRSTGRSPAPAGVRAQAVHLRPRVRIGIHAGERAG